MRRDLKAAVDGHTDIATDVCIVGAGTAGLLLAQRLESQGIQCVLLEGGDETSTSPQAAGHQCEQRGAHYLGAEAGRSFGIGGTSVLWGGQMLPLTPWEMMQRAGGQFDAWPISYDEVVGWIPEVERALGLDEGAFDVGLQAERARRYFPLLSSFGSDFELALSTWLPFGKRNFGHSFSDMLDYSASVLLWINAPVVDLVRSPEGNRVSAVVAQASNGARLQVRARLFVLCAGALESTRLLLEYDAATGGAITQAGAPLGQYFQDHLSVTCGHLTGKDRRKYNLAVAPVFVNGLMRSPRLVLSESAQRRLGSTSAFAHFTFKTNGDSGFDMVRTLLRRYQGERQLPAISTHQLLCAARDVSALAYWKLLRRRLWIPNEAELLLQIDIEQHPNPRSRITLSGERDALGRRRLALDWQITPVDVQFVKEVARTMAAAWEKSPLNRFADIHLAPTEALDRFESLYDVYHPTGALRMGDSARNSVVDGNLRVWAAENLYASTTAVFPSAGCANPGLTHLSLTARLAAHLANIVRNDGA